MKNEEILNLKNAINEICEKIHYLEEGNIRDKEIIKNYEKDISKFVIENSELKREILKKEINEKEYSIGKLIMKKNDDGINECFLEGNEFKRIAGLIKKYMNLII